MDRFKIGPPLIFLVIFSFVLLVGGTMPYFLFYAFLLTVIFPLVHILLGFRGLKGSVKVPRESLFYGESINIEYEIRNNSIFRITYLEIQNDISKHLTGIDSPKIALSLNKKESFSSKETVVLKRRGYYQLGEIIVTIRDVFGFYHFKKSVTSDISLVVYPKIINLSTFKINTSHQLGDLLVQDSVFQDKSRITSLREYKEGDSVKAIHWKLFAKKDIPIVKDYENRGDTYVSIFIDNEAKLFENDIDRRIEDKLADVTLSIVNYCLSQNIEINLETQNEQRYVKIQGRQSSDFKDFLETLTRFRGNGSLDFKSLLIPRIEMLKKSSTVIIITSNLDKTMGSHGIYLKMKNLNPLFIVITDMENSTGYIDHIIEKRLKQENILIYIIDYKTSIIDILEASNG